jgi:KDO2-lipid IV(A) lauroyltransferase
MIKFQYYLIRIFYYLFSLLPFSILYFLSDILFYPLYYLVRYRRKIVRHNLVTSFPEKTKKEIIKIEKDFYSFLCDYFVETAKLFSITKEQLMKRMTFDGIDEMVNDLEKKDFCFVYLGHYCNWEWIASLPYWVPDNILCAQIYHPLRNKAYDKVFLDLRGNYGGECIGMKETLRRIIELRREHHKTIIGFISDQTPKQNSIHHWMEFFHKDTPVFTGTEKIGKQVDAAFYYGEVTRPKRGYYHCSFKHITSKPQDYKDYDITDLYMHLLEDQIKKDPALWLWSHNRWKRTREENKIE